MKWGFLSFIQYLVLSVLVIITGCTQPQYNHIPSKSTDIAAYHPKDYPKAYAYFKEKAEHGDSNAMDNLGHMYEDGRGVAQNQDEAVYWFSKAAHKGNSDAEVNLGVAYLYGNGVKQNKQMACDWLHKATKAANPYARELYGESC